MDKLLYLYLDFLATQSVMNGRILNSLLSKNGGSEHEVDKNEELLRSQMDLLTEISKLWR